MWMTSTTKTFLTAKLLKQGKRYHKIRKAFSKFNHIHAELIVKYNIGLKTLLQQGISEPIFYGALFFKFKRIVGKPNFSDQFKKIIKRYKNGLIYGGILGLVWYLILSFPDLCRLSYLDVDVVVDCYSHCWIL